MAGFFKDLFVKNKLVDIMPAEIVPTWRNGRDGNDSIEKILDHFYVAEDLLVTSQRYRSWVEFPYF
jgi:hypothetical protein